MNKTSAEAVSIQAVLAPSAVAACTGADDNRLAVAAAIHRSAPMVGEIGRRMQGGCLIMVLSEGFLVYFAQNWCFFGWNS
jgi:hypothetical protein